MQDLRERPALDIGVGMEVLVIRSSNLYRGNNEPIPATVVKASRVWIELRALDRWGATWKMRRDTQNEGNTMYPQNNARFVTHAQHEWETALKQADAVLREQGIELSYDSPWKTPARRFALAQLLQEGAKR